MTQSNEVKAGFAVDVARRMTIQRAPIALRAQAGEALRGLIPAVLETAKGVPFDKSRVQAELVRQQLGAASQLIEIAGMTGMAATLKTAENMVSAVYDVAPELVQDILMSGVLDAATTECVQRVVDVSKSTNSQAYRH